MTTSMTISETVSIAKIYVRSIVAIVCLTAAIAFGAYLGQVSENIWITFIGGVVACVLFDKPTLPNA